MEQRAADGPRGLQAWPLVAAAALLVAVNLLNNVVAPGLYLVWACLGVAGLAGLAGADGLRPEQWGLGPLHRRAAIMALVLAGATVVTMLLATRVPGLDAAFSDDRVAGLGAAQLGFAALLRAPFGTAVLEEVAFRGVLLAMLTRRFGTARGVGLSSAAFGLWHIAPGAGLVAGNEAVASALGGSAVVGVCVAVAAAGAAGVVLCWLRLRYDHLIVPVAVHAASTSAGYLLAWLMMA